MTAGRRSGKRERRRFIWAEAAAAEVTHLAAAILTEVAVMEVHTVTAEGEAAAFIPLPPGVPTIGNRSITVTGIMEDAGITGEVDLVPFDFPVR